MAEKTGFLFGGAGPAGQGRAPLDAYYRAVEQRKVPWSALRGEILSLLWHSGTPWGPYEIAARLSRDGARGHPNSVYRALRSLETAGLVIPIVSWSRHLLSPDPAIGCWCVILCPDCRRFAVTPMAEQGAQLRTLAAGHRFRPEQIVIECTGRCRTCGGGAGPPAQVAPGQAARDRRLSGDGRDTIDAGEDVG